MICQDFQGQQLPMLGFGTMHLPRSADGTVDELQTAEMVRCAMEHGIKYFDTAELRREGECEQVMGRILKTYPRESFYLAGQFSLPRPGEACDPAAAFESQLKRCGTDYFDFYLLDNVYERSINVYTDPKWGIVDYFLAQKRDGRIRHLGFSSHGGVEVLDRFLQVCGPSMEFCQIQLNCLDWTVQDAQSKCQLLQMWDLPIWVMAPLRGGALVRLAPEDEAELRHARPQDSVAAWAFRWLQGIQGVTMVLGGASSLVQLKNNISVFESWDPLSMDEEDLLMAAAEKLKSGVPCTGCGACLEGCPRHLNIPALLNAYNDLKIAPDPAVAKRVAAMPPEKQPEMCIGCGRCARVCPQGINVPIAIKEMGEILSGISMTAAE